VRLNQRILEYFKEDRRFERKGCKKIHFDELATYYSTFSNTPDGGLLVFGIEDNGELCGCSQLSTAQLNSIETSRYPEASKGPDSLRRQIGRQKEDQAAPPYYIW